MVPLADVTLPVLELNTTEIPCRYRCLTEMEMAASAEDTAQIPVSFRALWLRTDHMVRVAEHSGGAVLESEEQEEQVDPAEEFCRFLGRAPGCYEEFRVFAGGGQPMLTIAAEWELNNSDFCGVRPLTYNSLQHLAANMQQFAQHHSLAVSLSDDEMYLRVVRTRPSG